MASVPETRNGDQLRRSVLPPWLWFWFILYLVGLPATFQLIQGLLGNLLTGAVPYTPLEKVTSIAEFAFLLVLVLGVFLIFCPPLRASYLRWKYGLAALSTFPANEILFPTSTEQNKAAETVRSIEAFVHESAPAVLLTYNATKQMSERAFVYPIGYRKVGLALSRRFLALWDADRPIAEATLLHEIAHYRQGDTFIVGTGSLLGFIIKYWVLIVGVFVFAPLLIETLLPTSPLFSERELTILRALNIPVNETWHTFSAILLYYLPVLLLIFVQELFFTASIITIVIMAVWCAEINADRFVLDALESRELTVRVLKQSEPTPWLTWLLTDTYHPPMALRFWFMKQAGSGSDVIRLLLLFPLAWAVRLMFLVCWALSQYLLFLLYGISSLGSIMSELWMNVLTYLKGIAPGLFMVSLLIALWPYLSRYWERLFASRSSLRIKASYAAYLSATGIVLFFSIMSFLLPLLQPAVHPPPPPPPPTVVVSTATVHIVLRSNYQGSIVNTTDGANVSSKAALTSLVETEQGLMSGNMVIQPPLVGSGPFTGSVNGNGFIQFIVVPSDGSYAAITFTGKVNADGSMSGTYTLPGTNQLGDWSFQPVE